MEWREFLEQVPMEKVEKAEKEKSRLSHIPHFPHFPPRPDEIEKLIQVIAEHYSFNQDDVAEMMDFSRRHHNYAMEQFAKWARRL